MLFFEKIVGRIELIIARSVGTEMRVSQRRRRRRRRQVTAENKTPNQRVCLCDQFSHPV